MIIDVHAHAFPDKLAARAVDTLVQRANLPMPEADGTLAGLLASMSSTGIARAWVPSIATRPEQASAILDWSKRIRSDRIEPLGSLHPDSVAWEAELAAISDAGLLGVKFHPQYQGFVVDDSRYFPIFRAIADRGLFVLIHGGYDPAFPGDESAAPRRLARLHREVPDLVMIAAHLGGWRAWGEVIEHLVGTEIYFDTSFMNEATPEQKAHIFQRHPRTRILFGSDTPWDHQRDALAELLAQPLATEHQALVLGGNAELLVNSLEAKRRRWQP
jgi:uncharacterized protein